MDLIIQDAQQLLQPKNTHFISEDEFRQHFNSLTLSENSIAQLQQSKVGIPIDQEFVYMRVLIEDIYDGQVFVGAFKNNEDYVVHVLGNETEVQQGQLVYFDQKVYKATILDGNHLYKSINKKCHIKGYLNDQSIPQIFNVVNVFGKIEHEDEQDLVIAAIKFIKLDEQLKNKNLDLIQYYQELVVMLSQLLNNELVGEFMALNILISFQQSMYQDAGRLILNVYNIDQEISQIIKKSLEQIYTPFLYVSLDMELLKNYETLTKRNFDTNQLDYGLLIAPTNLQTNIYIDETVMKEGQIGGKGLMNLQNIKNFITYSKVGIDYQYQVVEIPIRSSVLITSVGKTFFEGSINIKSTQHMKQQQNMNLEIRNLDEFITHVHNNAFKCNLSEEFRKNVNETYLKLRQDQNKKIEPMNLNFWILASQVLSFINGHKDIQQQYFEKVVKMDLERIKVNEQ